MSLILWIQESQDIPVDRSAPPPSTRLLLVPHRHMNYLPSCAVWLKKNHLTAKRFHLGWCRSPLQEWDILERHRFSFEADGLYCMCGFGGFGLFSRVIELFWPLGWTWKNPLYVPSKLVHSVLLSALFNSRRFCPFKHMQLLSIMSSTSQNRK